MKQAILVVGGVGVGYISSILRTCATNAVSFYTSILIARLPSFFKSVLKSCFSPVISHFNPLTIIAFSLNLALWADDDVVHILSLLSCPLKFGKGQSYPIFDILFLLICVGWDGEIFLVLPLNTALDVILISRILQF